MVNTADNVNPGSGQSGVPTSVGSDQGGALSSGDATLAAALKEIQVLKGHVSSLMSGHDKGVNRVEGKLDGVYERLDRYDQLIADGLTPKQARRELALDEVLAERNKVSGDTLAQSPVGIQGQQAKVDHGILLASMGLDTNDPEVNAILREGGDELTTIVKYGMLAQARKVKPAPTPNPAQQVPVPSGSSVTTTASSLMAEYREMIKNAPEGETGTKIRHDAKIAVRVAAKEAGIESPV